MSIIQGNSIESGVSTYQIERSLRFNSADSAYLSWTPASAGNRKTWTWSGWVKRSRLGTEETLFACGTTASNTAFGQIIFSSDDKLRFNRYYDTLRGTNAVYRDVSAWYHIVVVLDTPNATAADRAILYVNNERVTSFEYSNDPTQNIDLAINQNIQHTIGRYDPSGGGNYLSAYLTEVNFIDGQALDPTSFGEYNSETGVWQPIAYAGTYGTNGFYLNFSDNTGTTNATLGKDYSSNADVLLDNSVFTATAPLGGTANNLKDNDTSTTLTTSSTPTTGQVIGHYDCGSAQTVKGVRVANYTQANSSSVSFKVQYSTDNSSWSDFGSSQSVNPGNVAKVYDIIATQQSARYWRLIANQNHDAAVTVGDFILATQLGNNWTPNNFSVTAGADNDSLVDTPTPYGTDTGVGGEVRGNYATLNPLLSAGGTTSNGNLQVTTTAGVGHSRATIAIPNSGKWYAEFTAISASTSTDYIFGIVGSETAEASYGYNQTPSYSYTAFGERIVNGSFTSSFYSSFTTGDIIGCAVDLDTNQLTWYKNGTAQTAISITNGSYFWIVSDASGSRQITAGANFGQRPFAYTAPSGFKAMCTQNLPEPTVVDGSTAMNVITWSGTGGSRSFTGVGFSPDLVWTKSRSNVWWNVLFDRLRSGGQLSSNQTDAELASGSSVAGYVSSYDADGFSTTAGSSSNGTFNASGDTYVAWNWKAGGTGVSNTAGSITSTVSANTTAGFSIVTYTGTGANATVGHGIGTAPTFIIVKRRNSATAWPCLVKAANGGNGQNGRLNLNETASYGDNIEFWNNTSPTSTVFSVGIHSTTNASGGTYVAYCFAPVEGYSAFGGYTGNGSSDGPMIFTNHRPAFVLIKRTDASENWVVYDFARDSYNLAGRRLLPNGSNAEAADTEGLDLLSNGFKVRGTSSLFNTNGGTYIYMSLASNPFKFSLAR